MPSYNSYSSDVGRIQTLLSHELLRKVAFRQFKQERGREVHKVLPDKSSEYEFQSHGFDGFIDPDNQEFYNPTFHGNPITVSDIAANPHVYEEIVDSLYNAWWDTFGENYNMASQPSHPGDPPITKEALATTLKELTRQHELITADPTLDDLVGAIQDKNYRLAAQFLNIDQDPQALFNPAGEHEMTALFTHGDVNIAYRDRDIVVLKPEYDHELREDILSQQAGRLTRVRLVGEQPELAFVVGLDDTPTGLFAHSIDGTRLDPEQEITREYIHDVMGFDYNYRHESFLDCAVGDRIRLQGDLAVEYVSNTETATDSAPRCNLPIDNHLALLNHAELADGETKETEPITVNVPSCATLNIMHDEHDNVSTELPAGQYRFYLLPRGLQLEEDRPSWLTNA